MSKLFARVASAIATAAGSPLAFILAVALVLVWILTGPIFGFSDTWQLVINTGTTIVTFLMVFLIQNSQNRDTRALHLKLDELLRAMKGAREDRFLDLEDLDEHTLGRMRDELFAEAGVSPKSPAHAAVSRFLERHSHQ